LGQISVPKYITPSGCPSGSEKKHVSAYIAKYSKKNVPQQAQLWALQATSTLLLQMLQTTRSNGDWELVVQDLKIGDTVDLQNINTVPPRGVFLP